MKSQAITIRKGYKFCLKANPEQQQLMAKFAGHCRFVWNKALALNLARLEQKQPLLWYQEMNYWATLWKQSEDYGFLKDAPSQALQQALKNLDRAFKDAFDKQQPNKRIPRFKRKGMVDSFRYPQGFKLDEKQSRIFLPKIGWVKYRNSRPIEGKPKNVTISRRGKHWYISVQTEQTIAKPTHTATTLVGVDVGIKRLVTLSNGSYCEPKNSFKQLSKKLAFEQRKLKRKVRFSANWKKQQQRIAKLHEKIANARHDYLHKITSQISKNHAIIVVEDLKIKNMSASAKGNAEQHGKNVKQKSGLNRSILDQGWGTLINMLEYKQEWAGGDLLKVNPMHTSQTCPVCHTIDKRNRPTQAEFKCVECGYADNADVVAAKNIAERGHRLLACGESA